MREKKELNVKIGERIRRARTDAHVTQERLAEMIDVSPQYISDLERGVVGISVATLRRVCTALRVSSDSILFDANGDQRVDAYMNVPSFQWLTERQRNLLLKMIECFIEAIKAS